MALAGVSDVVDIMQCHANEVQWQSPVALLFIDGLHDYKNVAKDFTHFSAFISPGGYVAFHDYADYFPGVKRFVDELVATGTYSRINNADTLIVLQKM